MTRRIPQKQTVAHPASAADGVYPMSRLSKTQSLHRKSTASTGEEAEDDDAGLRRAGDYKHKQAFSGKYLLWLAYQSIGLIYGDIGTSPLYVFSSTFSSPPSYADLVDALSLILWSLTMIVTVKYVLVILRADNDGEGETFSTYALLSRYANITSRDPREASPTQMRRYRTGDLGTGGNAVRSGFEHSRVAQTILKVVGCLAVTMGFSDGVLTPAQSVLGADHPLVFSAWVSKVAAVPECQIFFHMRPLETPSVTSEERYAVSRLGLGLGYRIVLRHGYNDNIITPDLGQILYEQVRAFVIRTSPSHVRGNDFELSDRLRQDSEEVVRPTDADPRNYEGPVNAVPVNKDKASLEEDFRATLAESEVLIADAKWAKTVDYDAAMRRDLARLEAAYNHQVLYIIDKEEMKVKPGTGIVRSILLKAFLWMRENSRTKVADLRVPTDRVIEVGFVKEV
ncbi:hypothetical protein LTR50_007039 [Elasticomyces elasticus]|nr:hypothetical protein LTR50_007039 [Elasticomyces elasticus]